MSQASHPPVFLIVGPVGHGKTTAREILCRLTHLKGGSCSDVIYAFLAFRKNTSQEALRQLPKASFRAQLIEAGDWMVGKIEKIKEEAVNKSVDDSIYRIPSALIRTLYMNGYNVIDGVRRENELTDAINHLEWNGIRTLVIHIVSPSRPVIEDNSENLYTLANEHVVNDGTVEQLEEKLRALFPKHFGAALEDVHPAQPIIDIMDVPKQLKA